MTGMRPSQASGEKLEHGSEAVEVRPGKTGSAAFREPRPRKEQLGHQSMVGHGRFVIGAVLQHLDLDLLLQRRDAEVEPHPGRRIVLEDEGDEEEADDIAQEVVARDLVVIFEVLEDEVPVVKERFVGRDEAWRLEARGPKILQSHGPAGRPQRHVHGARPLDAASFRIRFHEVGDLGEHLRGELGSVGEPEGLGQDREVLAAREFPGMLDVGQAGAHFVEAPVLEGDVVSEPQIPDRVEGPVDGHVPGRPGRPIGIPGHERSAAEKVELVTQDALGGLDGPRRDLRVVPGESREHRVAAHGVEDGRPRRNSGNLRGIPASVGGAVDARGERACR